MRMVMGWDNMTDSCYHVFILCLIQEINLPSFDRLVVERDSVVHEVTRQGGRDVNAEAQVSDFAFFLCIDSDELI